MSAPKLGILGHIYDHYPRLEIGPTVFQVHASSALWSSQESQVSLLHHGVKIRIFLHICLHRNLTFASSWCEILYFLCLPVTSGFACYTMAKVLRGVMVLSLSNKSLSLNAVLNVMKCFSCLEMLNIQVSTVFICINYFVTQYSIDTCSRVDCHYF